MEIITPDGATTCVVLAHPHPDYGGSMHVPVIEGLFRGLDGVARLRFDFRGSAIDLARADLVAAIDAVPVELDVVACGYSFGADVSLSVGHERITQWIAITPPLSLVPLEEMVAASDPRPKLLLPAEHDQHFPPDRAASKTAGWTNTSLEIVPGTDHFLGGATRFLVEAISARL